MSVQLSGPHELRLRTSGRGLHELTAELRRLTASSGIASGQAQLFVHHTSCSLIVGENADPDVQADTLAYFERLVPDGDPRYAHSAEGPDDMAAHLRSMLTATSLALPIRAGALDLGTWQGVFLFEHRTSAHVRRLSLTLLGSADRTPS